MADEIVKDVVYRIRLQIDESLTPKPQGILAGAGVSPVMPSPVGMTAAGVSDSVRMATETGNITRELGRLASVLQGVTSHIDATTRASVAQSKAASVPVPGRPDWYHGAIGGVPQYNDFITDAMMQAGRQYGPQHYSSSVPGGVYGPRAPMMHRMSQWMRGAWDVLSNAGVAMTGGFSPRSLTALPHDMNSLGWMLNSGNTLGAMSYGAQVLPGYLSHIGKAAGPVGIGVAAMAAMEATRHQITAGMVYRGGGGDPYSMTMPRGYGVGAAMENFGAGLGQLFSGRASEYTINSRFGTEQQAEMARIAAGVPRRTAMDGTSRLTNTDTYLMNLDAESARTTPRNRRGTSLQFWAGQDMAYVADSLRVGWAYNMINGPRMRGEGVERPALSNVESGTGLEFLYDQTIGRLGFGTYSDARIKRINEEKTRSTIMSNEERKAQLRLMRGKELVGVQDFLGTSGLEMSYGMESIGAQLRGRRTSVFDDPAERFGFAGIESLSRSTFAAGGSAVEKLDRIGRGALTSEERATLFNKRAEGLGLQRQALEQRIGVREQMMGMYEQQGAISGNWMLRYGTMAPNERVVLKGISEQVKDKGVGSLNQWELEYAAGTGQSRLAQEELRRRYKDDAEDIRKVLSPNLTPKQAEDEAAARARDFAGTDYGDTTKMTEKFRKEIETMTESLTEIISKAMSSLGEAIKASAAAASESINKTKPKVGEGGGSSS